MDITQLAKHHQFVKRYLKVLSHEIYFFLKSGQIGCIDFWNDIVFTKTTFKKRKIYFLENFCGYLGPCNYVSMIKWGKHCFAPKLHGASFEESKTLRDAD